MDELLEVQLGRFHFRGARRFLWRYRRYLSVVRAVLRELEQAVEDEAYGSEQGIRNPGGLIRWRVQEEVGDGDD